MLVVAALAVVVGAVLLHGAARRHAPVSPTSTPPPETGARVLRAELEKTPLSYFSDYWLQLGNGVKTGFVLVGSQNTPALVVRPGLAVSSIDGADGAVPGSAPAAGSPRLLAADAMEGIALFELDPPVADKALRAADPASLHTGMLVAAVSLDHRDRPEVIPGHLVSVAAPVPRGEGPRGVDSLDVSLRLPAATRAAAIVDLDGKLVGAAFGARGSIRLVSAEILLATIERLRADPNCRSLEVADLDDTVRKGVGFRAGVAVEGVYAEAFVPEPSIRAGDLLLEWNGQEVRDAAEFERSYDAARPGALVPYLVRRGRRVLSGRTRMPGPDCRPLGEPPVSLPEIGFSMAWVPAATPGGEPSLAWSVTEVAPGSPAQHAGLRAGDRILRVDGSGGDRREILRGLSAFEPHSTPIVLTLQRKDRVKLVALPAEGT